MKHGNKFTLTWGSTGFGLSLWKNLRYTPSTDHVDNRAGVKKYYHEVL
ncbi:hypothetical protein MTBMA_c04320 [Methanothermobacter marburgensis str. Marburg]|uniref:Uncharacterized protein n=1 Tax=Methanothermobacter marburgensis (strain ATCC BAA-927 / DSM 2133 / JCM 14651 / NBRC 100331 / OCM 82 / Marburg) TaxID=79929 RepID=D9PUY6_METTM|nr:hypothetical protein MTBMA_c04320 [Methanothermobacter marburgensis str. Marburg]